MKVEASKKLSALMASILNSTLREGGSSTYIIEWGHIAEYIRMLIKMKIRCKDFYRILARPEAYEDNGFDQVNVTALARLRDYDNHDHRAAYTTWSSCRFETDGVSRTSRLLCLT
jgi:hypothetical protein